MKKTIIAITVLLTTHYLYSQNPTEELEQYKKKHPESFTVTQFVNEEFIFDVVNEKIKITSIEESQSIILNQNDVRIKRFLVEHDTFNDLKLIEAYSLVPSGKKYTKKKVSFFSTKDNLSEDHFYDNTKTTSFEFEQLAVGAKYYIKKQFEIPDPNLLIPTFFISNNDVEKYTLKLRTHPSIEIGYKLFNCDSIKIQIQKTTTKDNFTEYLFVVEDIHSLKIDYGAPDVRYFSPHIHFFIKSHKTKKQTTNYFGDIAALNSYYYDFIKDVNNKTDTAIQKQVEELIKDKTNEIDKVKVIYQWIQSNIKYIAFEDGYGRFIPRSSSLVFKRRYGDCKDMAGLIHEMLKVANINSYWTWIGSRSIPYTYAELPTPGVDNHMINTYIDKNGNYYFLDGTSSNTPFGMPSAFIQDKEALIQFSRDSFQIKKVPIVAKENNQTTDSIFFKINNNTLEGRAVSYYFGYPRENTVAKLRDLTGTKRQEAIKSLHTLGNNKFELIDYKEHNLNDKDLPYIVEYNFKIPNYILTHGDETYINMNLENHFASLKLKDDRKQPYDNSFHNNFNLIIQLEIPNNYKINYVPENSSYANDLFGYNFNYITNKTNNTITLNQNYYINFLLLQKDKFSEFNQFINQISKAYKETLILIKK